MAQRIKPITPPRHSMPPGTGTSVSPSDGPFWDFRTRDPLPLHLHSRRMSVDSASDAEYNEDDYGDLPSRRYGEVDTPGGGASANGSPARKVKARSKYCSFDLHKMRWILTDDDSSACTVAHANFRSYCRVRIHRRRHRTLRYTNATTSTSQQDHHTIRCSPERVHHAAAYA